MKVKVTLRCIPCGHKYTRVLPSEDAPDPPCPACDKREKVRGMDFSTGRAPAVVGMSTSVKAIDQTAEIVMQDHGMTDLKSNVREGETSAPPLAPQLQKMADGFFGGGRRKNPMIPNAAMLGRRALAGSYSPGVQHSPDPVAVAQAPRTPMPIRLINPPRTR
jgi:hypothetical protein